MEKNQHSHEENSSRQTNNVLPQQAPGQQVPSNADANKNSSSGAEEKDVQHSESSLPQSDNETLGTP